MKILPAVLTVMLLMAWSSHAESLFDVIEAAEEAAKDRKGIAEEHALAEIRDILNQAKLDEIGKIKQLRLLTMRLKSTKLTSVESVRIRGFVESLNELQKQLLQLQRMHPDNAKNIAKHLEKVRQFRRVLLTAASGELRADRDDDDDEHDDDDDDDRDRDDDDDDDDNDDDRGYDEWGGARKRAKSRDRNVNKGDFGLGVDEGDFRNMSWADASNKANSKLREKGVPLGERIDNAISVLKAYKKFNPDDERAEDNLTKLYKKKMSARQ